jgi:hypothetical protein
MSSSVAPSQATGRATGEAKIARLFGLKGDSWLRHANPVSVWSRFAVLPLLAISIWSRDWIGWWSLVPIVLSLVFMMVNPLLFPEPRSTRNWASKAVFGEHVWSERDRVPVPDRYVSKVPNATYAFQTVGLIIMVYGLVRLDVVATVSGLLICQVAKAWYLDRMVLLYDDMKTRHAEYAKWEY